MNSLLCQQLRKIALAFRRGQYGENAARRRLIVARTLVIREKEQLVANNASAEGCAELVPAQQRPRQPGPVVAPVVCVQFVVANKLKSVAVERVRAALRADADDAAHEVAELSRSILGNHVEFLNGIDAGRITDGVF